MKEINQVTAFSFYQYERQQYLIDFETNQYLINMKQINQVSGLSPLNTATPNFAVTPGKPKPHHSFTRPTNQLCLTLTREKEEGLTSVQMGKVWSDFGGVFKVKFFLNNAKSCPESCPMIQMINFSIAFSFHLKVWFKKSMK